jgi:amino acid transporter
MSILGFILGRRLANREQAARKIGAFEGVPAMGLDGLSSSAYGPEAALTMLVPLGAAGLVYFGPIILIIVALLAILYVSYRQTIRAYPNNGGSYVVCRENFGPPVSLLAAAALMIDYVLNVAVGISAGIGALVSAVPQLHSYTLLLCLAVLALVTILNLRGTIDAGRVFALPTYLFVVSLFAVLALGVWRSIEAGGHPQPVVAPPPMPGATEAVSLWILVRAFASGCTAMTGVEAVSNGVSAFKDPAVPRAHRTLTTIVVLLAILLAGIAYLAEVYGIGAMPQDQPGYQSVLSQLVAAVVGRDAFYYVTIGSVLCVLALSANTSFVDFPRLCRLVAEDSFLPRSFAAVGRRLVYSVGISFLAVTAGFLLVVFDGITDRLIPLFAVGAFLTFTLSQAGMVVHWTSALRRRDKSAKRHSHRAHLVVNAVGATATGVALIVIVVAKFTEGAWMTLLAIPLTILLLRSIRRYYDRLETQLRDSGPLKLGSRKPPIVVVATEGWNKLTDRALALALRLSPDVIAVHLVAAEGPGADKDERSLRRQWAVDVERPARAVKLPPPRLVMIPAPYRCMHVPLLEFLESLEKREPARIITVLIPELVIQNWWQHLLHTHRARRLGRALLRYGGPNVVVIRMPWHLHKPPPMAEVRAEEDIPTTAAR